MKYLKYLKYLFPSGYILPIIIGIILILLASTGGIFYYHTQVSQGGQSSGGAEFQEYRKIDKLFTAFAYIPLVQYKKGYLKREILTGIALFKEKEAVMGYCFRQYEVGIGYDQVSNLFPQHQDAACQKKFQELPEPNILATNPVSSQALGTYTREDCDSWDVGNLDERESRQFITSQLEGEQWQEIVKNSQKILMSFMQVYCPEAQERSVQ